MSVMWRCLWHFRSLMGMVQGLMSIRTSPMLAACKKKKRDQTVAPGLHLLVWFTGQRWIMNRARLGAVTKEIVASVRETRPQLMLRD